jgi:hypothetical protein
MTWRAIHPGLYLLVRRCSRPHRRRLGHAPVALINRRKRLNTPDGTAAAGGGGPRGPGGGGADKTGYEPFERERERERLADSGLVSCCRMGLGH